MTDFFKVKNFERFQHYKDRSPPWIKLYNEMLDDYEFASLPDASKAHLIAIWLLASRSDNRIPYDARWLSNRINATDPVDLEILEQLGFIEKIQGRSNLLANRKQNACLETETETETEGEGGADAPKYAFRGRVIRLLEKDFDAWRAAYPNVDMAAELQAADDWYFEHPPPAGQWYFRVSNWLKRATAEAKDGKRGKRDGWAELIEAEMAADARDADGEGQPRFAGRSDESSGLPVPAGRLPR